MFHQLGQLQKLLALELRKTSTFEVRAHKIYYPERGLEPYKKNRPTRKGDVVSKIVQRSCQSKSHCPSRRVWRLRRIHKKKKPALYPSFPDMVCEHKTTVTGPRVHSEKSRMSLKCSLWRYQSDCWNRPHQELKYTYERQTFWSADSSFSMQDVAFQQSERNFELLVLLNKDLAETFATVTHAKYFVKLKLHAIGGYLLQSIVSHLIEWTQSRSLGELKLRR